MNIDQSNLEKELNFQIIYSVNISYFLEFPQDMWI